MIISLNLSSYIFINSPFKITLRNNKKIRVKTFLWVKNFWRLKKVCGLNTLRVISSLFSVLNTLRVHKFTLRNECKKCSMLAICFRIYWDLTVLVLSFHISCDVKFLIFFFWKCSQQLLSAPMRNPLSQHCCLSVEKTLSTQHWRPPFWSWYGNREGFSPQHWSSPRGAPFPGLDPAGIHCLSNSNPYAEENFCSKRAAFSTSSNASWSSHFLRITNINILLNSNFNSLAAGNFWYAT